MGVVLGGDSSRVHKSMPPRLNTLIKLIIAMAFRGVTTHSGKTRQAKLDLLGWVAAI